MSDLEWNFQGQITTIMFEVIQNALLESTEEITRNAHPKPSRYRVA